MPAMLGELPSLSKAETYLLEAEQRNPVPWVAHSRVAAQAMYNLAEAMRDRDPKYAELDPQRAFIYGLMHDIGRREGVHGMRHVVDGYRFLESEGYPAAGRACMVHSYPDPGLVEGGSGWDGRPEDQEFVRAYITSTRYDAYDRLVQLADAVCMPHGFVLLEKRMLDVVLRYGIDSDRPVRIFARRWRAFMDLKDEIEASIGGSIYDHLPGAVKNTFG